MTEIVFAMDIVPGKENLYRQTWDELEGARRDEYAAAIKDAGMTRQAVWHQQTPDGGTLAIVYIEATDRDAPLRYLDTFVKTDGTWLFAERKLYVDWTETRSSHT